MPTNTTAPTPPTALAAALAMTLASTATQAQTIPPSYGHDFVTIGAPGNRAATALEAPLWETEFLGPLGRVDYTYRITRTEVTNGQYFRFITEYARTPGLPFSPSAALGRDLFISGFDPGGFPIIELGAGREQAPAEVTVLYAAAYMNWLHNDQRTGFDDFSSGAYDLTQFVPDPNTGLFPEQTGRQEGARYFLPSLNEWTKAAHYDPDRYGAGQEGYWLYPDGGSEPLATGLPGEPGAETSAGTSVFDLFDVGSYPGSPSPWGLLDVSGSLREATDTIGPFGVSRALVGSDVTTQPFDNHDRLDAVGALGHGDTIGFRVGSVIPAPSSSLVCLGATVLFVRRRRP